MHFNVRAIEAYPQACLLLPFGKSGSVLQLRGKGEVRFQEGGCIDGADREVRIKIEKVVETFGVQPAWELLELSNFAPPVLGEIQQGGVNSFLSTKKSVTVRRGKPRAKDFTSFVHIVGAVHGPLHDLERFCPPTTHPT